MIAAVVQQRELFASMLRREVRQRYKGSVLGILWSLVTPLVMMGAYTLVFSLIFTAVAFDHYPAFLLTGLSVWVFFAGGLEAGTASIVASANLVKKVAFERSIVPLASTMSHLVTFGAMVAVLVPVNLILEPDDADDDDPAAGPDRLPRGDDRGPGAGALGPERLLPRRAAHPGGAAAALVLPDADLLLARPASRERLRQRDRDQRAALREPH